ncbi:hypothetical protein PaelaDRAFT_1914 [Paenibacillus lactis 154]|uniref:Uncharacterized protein n=1 Tax=Paenibacillus lactis 154 TaxID=743719 RepID=G4HD61_9BACL|nr:hypothetical protein PaelaDRAFT_1914 [Paenibacillus lactis 154]
MPFILEYRYTICYYEIIRKEIPLERGIENECLFR